MDKLHNHQNLDFNNPNGSSDFFRDSKSLFNRCIELDMKERPEAYSGYRYGISPMFSAFKAVKTMFSEAITELLLTEFNSSTIANNAINSGFNPDKIQVISIDRLIKGKT